MASGTLTSLSYFILCSVCGILLLSAKMFVINMKKLLVYSVTTLELHSPFFFFCISVNTLAEQRHECEIRNDIKCCRLFCFLLNVVSWWKLFSCGQKDPTPQFLKLKSVQCYGLLCLEEIDQKHFKANCKAFSLRLSPSW